MTTNELIDRARIYAESFRSAGQPQSADVMEQMSERLILLAAQRRDMKRFIGEVGACNACLVCRERALEFMDRL